jgi:hypothetical protein
MTPTWEHPDFRRILQRCCDGGGITMPDFDRLLAITRDAPAEEHQRLKALIRLMEAESFPPDA